MPRKVLAISILAVVVLLGAYYLNTTALLKPDSSPLKTGLNAIYVTDQAPGETLTINFASLEAPGFVVIHESTADQPGVVLGASALVGVGETSNLGPITLNRATKQGETLFAMIHLDNGDGKFDLAMDPPAFDKIGNEPVTMIFQVNTTDLEATEVTL